jgi:molybdopterin/thiamine biosynthesis adenylyltransferase
MRVLTYRDESRSRHLDLTGGGGHPWSNDLVAATASCILLVGFGCAVAALLIR